MAKNVLLPVLDLARNTHVAEYWKILEKTQWLKREKIVELQQKRLRALLKHACENVPYYGKIFRQQGVYPGDFRTVEDLRKLPILRKTNLRSRPQQLMASNVPQEQMILCQTSGTTAAPMKFYRTRKDVSWGTAAWLRAYNWGGCELGDKHAVIWAFETSELRDPLFRLINILHRENLLLNAYGLSEISIKASAHRLERLRPKFLMGYSHSMAMLADYLLTKGICPTKPTAIFTTTQTLLASQRRAIERAFGCEVYDLYSSREFSLMASECAEHVGYHIQSENVVLEFLKDGEPVSPGETGKILVTSLNNYAMPFIRYEIGDMGELSDDICPCGRGLPLFKSLEGRTYEYFVMSNDSIVFLRHLDTVFEGLPVKTFQIVQRAHDEILVRVVKADGYSEKDTAFIKRNILWRHFQETTKVEVEVVESIPLEKSGKRRYIINKLPDLCDRYAPYNES